MHGVCVCGAALTGWFTLAELLLFRNHYEKALLLSIIITIVQVYGTYLQVS
jgi:hypothetical protein